MRARQSGGCRRAALLQLPQCSLISVSLPPISPVPPTCQPPTVHSTTRPHVGTNDDLVNLSAALLRVHHCAAAGREHRRASAAASLTRALGPLAAALDLCHINSEVHGVHGSHHSKSSTSPPARSTKRSSPQCHQELARSSGARQELRSAHTARKTKQDKPCGCGCLYLVGGSGRRTHVKLFVHIHGCTLVIRPSASP